MEKIIMKRKSFLILVVGLFVAALGRPVSAAVQEGASLTNGTCSSVTVIGVNTRIEFGGTVTIIYGDFNHDFNVKGNGPVSFPAAPAGTEIDALLDSTQGSFELVYTCNSPNSVPPCNSPDAIDGRLNAVCQDPLQSAALYCDVNGDGMVVLLVIDSKGYFAFHVTQHDLELLPAVQRALIMEKWGISLWRLSTGELQFNTPNGEIYTFGPAINGPVTFKQMCDGSVRWYHPTYTGPTTH